LGERTYTIRCYRKVPGDADCYDVPAFGEDILGDIVEQAGLMLLAYFNDQKRLPERKPHTAHIEDEHGQIVARIRVIGPEKIELISDQNTT
jgi:hypothetical protein